MGTFSLPHMWNNQRHILSDPVLVFNSNTQQETTKAPWKVICSEFSTEEIRISLEHEDVWYRAEMTEGPAYNLPPPKL